MRFCLVTTFYPPQSFGGDAVFVHRLANALAGRGHRVDVIHNIDAYALLADQGPLEPVPSHPNVAVYAVSNRARNRLAMIASHQLGRPTLHSRWLRRLIERSDCDVIHFHNVSLLGGPGIFRLGKALKLCTLHDYWSVCAMHVLWRLDREPCSRRTCVRCVVYGRRPLQGWRWTRTLARAARHVDAFVAPSHFSCRIHEAHGFPAPIRRLAHSVPDCAPASAPGVPIAPVHPRPYFLYVGRLEKLKGVQVLLRAFRSLTSVDLLVAGSGSYEQQLRTQAQGMPHVHFLGWLNQQRLNVILREAIALVVPSLCYETFGQVAIEAFATHTPVVVHDIGALPEVLAGGGGVLYRDEGELRASLERLSSSPQLRHTMGEQGHQSYLAHYTMEQHLREYFALIEELQARREARRRS